MSHLIAPAAARPQMSSEAGVEPSKSEETPVLLPVFLDSFSKLEDHKNGLNVIVDGHSLSIAQIVAVSRQSTLVKLDAGEKTRSNVEKSRLAIESKLASGLSVYGVSTGYGGSADTRTSKHLALGAAALQHHHTGILPGGPSLPTSLPLFDPLTGHSMPESWVRGAILIRINSLIRGHSGVQWSVMEAMVRLLNENIIPVVPLRGSISASGDLSPLSYVAGTLAGNPGIRVFDGSLSYGPRTMVPAPVALAAHGLKPHQFSPKEPLGLMNGTAFSAAVASLVLYDGVHLALLTQVCTVMGTEAMLGCQASHHPFIQETRPHPGQIEAARNMWNLLEGSQLAEEGEEKELTIEEDKGQLRQDRYSLRTSPQFIGPQLEDLLTAFIAVTRECNSTTDNPLVNGQTGRVHHGGNFQAMAVTNAMEKSRLSLHHLGKLLFSQLTEVLNPLFSHGLPPNLAGTDPSINYHCKGLDIAAAAYVSELGFLANPVSTHIQSAELHNQAVNSLALISARQTIAAIDVLTCLVASYLYVLCMALDLRAQQAILSADLRAIMKTNVAAHYSPYLPPPQQAKLVDAIFPVLMKSFDETSTMDALPRFEVCLASTTTLLVDFLISLRLPDLSGAVNATPSFRSSCAAEAADCHDRLRQIFLNGQLGPTPASHYMGKTRSVYQFIRINLGVRYHGKDNYGGFENGFTEPTIGQDVSKIYDSIQDGRMQSVVAALFSGQSL